MDGSYALGPRGNRDSFFNKMKKKPDVQVVLDNLDNYTAEQLANLEGSHFPQWIRDALVRKKEGMTKSDVDDRVAEIARKMIDASGEQVPYYKIEDLPIIEIEKSDSTKERKITSEDFTSSEDRRVGVILDSSTHGKHDDPGFEEHMKKVRERMKEK